MNPEKTESLILIHKLLFQEIYDWAGKLRDVNMSKGEFQFANVLCLKDNLNVMDNMLATSFEEIIEKYVELNIIHPFREGNGRATRLWLDMLLLHKCSLVIDWSQIDKLDYMSLMEQSVYDSKPLVTELKKITTTKIYDRELFFKGLDFSYYYEEQYEYDSQDLAKEMGL